MESMLSITVKFYQINNTSANHNKYVLITNSLPTSSVASLGVWFNITGSHDFVKKQVAQECNSFAATVRPAKLSAKQAVYLHNTVLIPKLEYCIQFTHLSDSECTSATSKIHSIVKHKANFSCSLPDPILFLSQGLGLINLFFHQTQSHLTNLFLLANSSSSFMKNLFLYRLRFIQFSFLIPISPLLVNDWAIWSKLFAFKKDYIACTIALLTTTPFKLLRSQLSTLPDLTISDGHMPLFNVMTPKISIAYFRRLRSLQLFYLSQFITPQGTHMITWNAYLSNLTSKKGYRVFPHKWFVDIQQNVTVTNSNFLLLDQYFSEATSNNIDLVPAFGSSRKSMKWIVSGIPLFGKQLSKQQYTCKIVHWISDCVIQPNDIITLSPCPSCSKHAPVTYTKCNLTDVTPLCIIPKLSPLRSLILPTTQEHVVVPPSLIISLDSAATLAFAASLLATPPDNHYCFYTDGSLINLGTPNDVMGWSWVQVLDGAGFFQSIAAHAHGVIHNWPSST
ncbi:hypothetical protein RhiirC2_782782 [Rhizophagus irregularis]|uniref:Uncharacterized protein n=1 Tax=Rhizophagus irregularis TaxID=588596 RepID=A0A2N1N2D5_9GLOM|nr:hypothetical protein RhiirC2_782782 [Rhizophagus irregularis]